jgi:putative FmdB family regulatory protein
MPLYEYRCDKGHKHERVRSVLLRNTPSRCGECGEEAVLVPSAPIWKISFGKHDKRVPEFGGYH